MRLAVFLLFISFQSIVIGQVQAKDSINKSFDYYIITEAYYIVKDTTLNLKEFFVDRTSGILFIPGKDSIILSINHGDMDSVLYLGFAKQTKNPGFNTTREDSEFYKWSYIKPNNSQNQEAIVMKEYVTGSLEKRGKKFYFFSIVNADLSELQIYGYQYETGQK